MSRRSTQNLRLDSLPASILSDSTRCNGYGAIGSLKHPDNNSYHFLSGVSFFKYFENTDIHLSFGDKFGSSVFLYALYEEGTAEPAQVLCLDDTVFMRYAFPSDDVQESVAPPSANEFVTFNTTEFLEHNLAIDQESVVKDNAEFKKAASRFISYLVQKKNTTEFKGIFIPARTETAAEVTAETLQSMQLGNENSQEIATHSCSADVNSQNEDVSQNKNKKKRGSKTRAEIDWAYDNHITPRKRSATVFFDAGSSKIPNNKPSKRNKGVIVDMNELEKEMEEKHKSKKKESKKKEKKTKAAKTPTRRNVSTTVKTTELQTPKNNSTPGANLGYNDQIVQQQAHLVVSKTKNEREEREYLRGQSLLDLDLETKRASNFFDLAERANRMATSNLEVMMSHMKSSKKQSSTKRKDSSDDDDTSSASSEEADAAPPSMSPVISVTERHKTTTSSSSTSTVQVSLTQEQLLLLIEAQQGKLGRRSR